MKKVLKYVLLISFLSLAFLFCNQTTVKAVEQNVKTMEQLKGIFGEEGVIVGNVFKLTNNVTIETDKSFNIEIPGEVIIELNGKTLQIMGNSLMGIENKTTFRDSLDTGCIKFIGETYGAYGIMVRSNGDLTIQNVNIINNNRITLVNTSGKLTINNSNFTTNCNNETLKEYVKLGRMFRLMGKSETVINGGNFHSISSIITAASDPNMCKLNINGGNYEVTDGYSAIDVTVTYPYVDENNEKKLIVPKIVLNNCNISHSFGSAVKLHTIYTDEITADTKIITILGGTYKGTVAPLHITAQGKYLNTNDIVIQNGIFENINTNDTGYFQGAISIGLTESSQFEYNGELKKFLDGYNGKIYYSKYNSCFETMRTIKIKDYKVVSASREITSKLYTVIDPGMAEDLKIMTDSKTNIKLEAQKDVIPDNTTMNITEITSGETFDKIKNILLGIKNFKAFDITLKVNDTNIQPNSKVKMSVPIPVGFDASRLAIYRFEEDGTKTEYKVKVENGYATFETEHFSIYVLGETTKLSSETQDKTDKNEGETTTGKNDTKLPQTGEETNKFAEYLGTVVVLAAVWLGSMLLIDREKKKMAKK